MSEDKTEVALKYLDLARGEILEKARFVNQTLGAYLLGSSALASWFYQSVYKPVSSTPNPTAVTAPEKAAAAIGLALVLGYLALGVNWITHHNERIIAALALYQRIDLFWVLGDRPPMWERSSALTGEDSLDHAIMTVSIQELIILGPPVAAFIFAASQRSQSTWTAHCWLGGALVANLASAFVGYRMFETKRKLRSSRISASVIRAGTNLSTPHHPHASK